MPNLEECAFYSWRYGCPIHFDTVKRGFLDKKYYHFDLYYYVKNDRAIEFFTKRDITDIVGIDYSGIYCTMRPSRMDPASFAKEVASFDKTERRLYAVAFEKAISKYQDEQWVSKLRAEREKKEDDANVAWLERQVK